MVLGVGGKMKRVYDRISIFGWVCRGPEMDGDAGIAGTFLSISTS